MSRRALQRPHRKVAVGDLSDLVKVQARTIEDPTFSDTDFEEGFSSPADTWARVRTVSGRVILNEVGVDVAITHEVVIRFVEGVTTESWVLLENGSRLRVADVEDLDERHEYLRLQCVDRGSREAEASRA